MSDPEGVYLEPWGEEDRFWYDKDDPVPEGRLWSEDDDPGGTGKPWVPYVRADIHKAEVGRLETENEQLREQRRKLASSLAVVNAEVDRCEAKNRRLRETLKGFADLLEIEWATCDGEPPPDVADIAREARRVLEADDG